MGGGGDGGPLFPFPLTFFSLCVSPGFNQLLVIDSAPVCERVSVGIGVHSRSFCGHVQKLWLV